MRIVELVIDEKEENAGIDAVSVVENPAIESDWVALKEHQVELKTVDEDKRILMGAALIPDKQIYRRNEKNEEYYIFFSSDTIRQASQLFLKKGNQNEATLEHQTKIEGMTVVESWIVEDPKKDKSALYGFNMPKGTWMLSMYVDNDDVWEKVKAKEVKGFSIEGYFQEKEKLSKTLSEDEVLNEIKNLISKFNG